MIRTEKASQMMRAFLFIDVQALPPALQQSSVVDISDSPASRPFAGKVPCCIFQVKREVGQSSGFGLLSAVRDL
jgi:hypothetical protein